MRSSSNSVIEAYPTPLLAFQIVYEPKSKYHDPNKEPPKMSKSFFGWLSPLIHVKEPELVDKVGLDAATFLRFLRMMRWLFTCLAILGGAALIPGDAIYSLKNTKPTNRTVLSILTIQDVFNNTLYVHIGALYAFTAVVCAFVWMNWKAMARLRHDWFRSPDYSYHFFARTLQITGVPRKFQSDEGIKAIFESMQVPYPTTSVHIGRSVGALPELVEYHNKMVCKLEKYLVRYLKGNKIGKKRPTVRIGGFLGMGGKSVDAIDYYTSGPLYLFSRAPSVDLFFSGSD
jgi:calcium permeable stress-gated cation channel